MDKWFMQAYEDIAELGRMEWETREALVEHLKEGVTDEQMRLLPTISHLLYGTSHTVVNQLAPRLIADNGVADHYAVQAVLCIVYGTRAMSSRNIPEVKDEHAKKDGHYRYIPHDRVRFVSEMHALRQLWDGTPRFIDVGSGIGDKVLLAHLLGYNAAGIEYNQQTYDIAKDDLYGWTHKVSMTRGDALVTCYHNYDLVYMYCPMIDRKNMMILYRRVLDQLAVGSVLFEILMYPTTLKRLATEYGFPFVPSSPDTVAIQRLDEHSYRCGFWNDWCNKLEWVTDEHWQPTRYRRSS